MGEVKNSTAPNTSLRELDHVTSAEDKDGTNGASSSMSTPRLYGHETPDGVIGLAASQNNRPRSCATA